MVEPTPMPAPATVAGVAPLPGASGLLAGGPVPWPAASVLAPSLSPSRAGDFMTCPLLYRFRAIDRIPEKPSKAAVRGTLVHRVLEELFDLPADERTLPAAAAMVPAAWDSVRSQDEISEADLFEDANEAQAWLTSAIPLLEAYFRLEDPRTLEPADRELRVETTLDGGLVLRGFIDRVDRNAAGEIRVVDYKTGKAPREGYEQKSLFQMRFYALVLWRITGTLPRVLQLLYLGSEDTIRYTPTEADLLATERKVIALWAAIERAHESGDWRPSPSRLCDWCDHKVRCPSFGGTPPPLPGRETTPGPISG
ncbi:unannotated protein [freshwater metagenome]|uniref:Unannotated protein n=1 Tax=freshwater metagenome TaxID=449393 RepID=A0A6J7C4X2_9ZZZZ